jgi:hypothetical protein
MTETQATEVIGQLDALLSVAQGLLMYGKLLLAFLIIRVGQGVWDAYSRGRSNS